MRKIAAHLAHEQDCMLASGLPAGEARRQARVRFGNAHAVRERLWRYRSLPVMSDVWRVFLGLDRTRRILASRTPLTSAKSFARIRNPATGFEDPGRME